MARLRHRFAATVGAALVVSTVAFGGGVASAQTPGYPPGSTTTVGAPCIGSGASVGSVAVGSVVTFSICGPFTNGGSVNVAVNGRQAVTKQASTAGTISIVLRITSKSVAEVDDPVNVAINCGANTVSANGPAFNGGTATQIGAFSLNCGSTTATGLAFTGANVLKGLGAALALIVVGAFLVVTQRRRSRPSA